MFSLERYSVEASGNKGKIFDARIKLADSALRNCCAVTDYIRNVSESVADEIDESNKMVSESLDVINRTRDLDALHSLYTEQLAPIWNKVEQEWHIIAEMRTKKKTSSFT